MWGWLSYRVAVFAAAAACGWSSMPEHARGPRPRRRDKRPGLESQVKHLQLQLQQLQLQHQHLLYRQQVRGLLRGATLYAQ
jgi:hypothetical protein